MECIIETENLTKNYGFCDVVREVNLHVPKGKIYGLLGRNGAGKTTIMKMMLNLVKPTEGTIRLFGMDNRDNSEKIYHKIGSIIETPGFYDNLTAYDNLQLMERLRGKMGTLSISDALDMVNLSKEKKKTFSDYSLGMKQRLGIAAAIIHEPELLILDEPINGLDPIGITQVRSFLLDLCKNKGTTILISSHVLSEIEQLADIIGVMQEGTLIEEVDMQELHQRRQRYVEFTVSDTEIAGKLLKKHYPKAICNMADELSIRIYGCSEDSGDMNKMFVNHGLTVTRINECVESLEDYFSGLIGGGDIA